MWDCGKCGCKAIADGLRACPMCGKARAAAPAPAPEPAPDAPAAPEAPPKAKAKT